MESLDLSAWMGKPPEKSPAPEAVIDGADGAHETAGSADGEVPIGSEDGGEEPTTGFGLSEESSSELEAIPYYEHQQDDSVHQRDDSVEEAAERRRKRVRFNSTISDDPITALEPKLKRQLVVTVPEIPEEEKEDYGYLPGHFTVRRILATLKGDNYVVKLESGERQKVSANGLLRLERGSEALQAYRAGDMAGRSQRAKRSVDVPKGMVSWNTYELSDEDSEASSHRRSRPRRSTDTNDSDVQELTNDDFNDTEDASDGSAQPGRRSGRLDAKRRGQDMRNELIDLDSSEDDFSTRRRRQPVGRISARCRGNRRSADEDFNTRKSERTRARPRHNMRELGEDEILSASEEETGTKIISTKESFISLPADDSFRKRHRSECDTCYHAGDNKEKGSLVFCQGCTNSHHTKCLGPRGSRDHLVTKIGEGDFILQCRRCIGMAHQKDKAAPDHGRCSVCNGHGVFSKPLRSRLTSKQEQLQREENGGRDPITAVDKPSVDNIANVLFRCATCQRAWHMHHLPNRATTTSQLDDDEDDEDLNEQQLAQKRFDLYHRSWTCKDCTENPADIGALVAWRPIDIENYVPGSTGDMIPESHKEYLVKWKNQSYLQTTWTPGSWIWGVATSAMRIAFHRKPENSLPKMTTLDAIPEDFFRVDIVFDVKYTSIVRDRSKEIDFARVKEIDTAFVKYKGLGYEDAIWEKPPSVSDSERWRDFQAAYEDFVLKRYTSIPVQATLRRHLLAIRQGEDFEGTVIKKAQPATLVGGELMKYQVEGVNWLLYQWYINQNAILADEMGLGKTIQIVGFFAALVQDHKCWPFLVVVPNTTCPNWRREIKKWAPSLRVVTYYGTSTARKLTHDYELFPKDEKKQSDDHHSSKKRAEVKDIKAHIVVASYESIVEEKARQSLMRVPWQGLVVDEGQRLKNDKNLVYEALSKFRFPFKVLLTGTPLQNNVRELFNLIQFLDKSRNAAELEQKYAEMTEENVKELHEELRKYFLRRTKVQVLTFLPRMAQIIVPVTMSALQKKVYKSILAKNPELMKSLFSRVGSVATKDRMNLNNILMQLRKTLCHPFVYSREIEERSLDAALSHRNLVEASSKLQLLSIMLPKLQERGHRVLLFSQFLDNLDIVEDFLDGLGMLHRRLDGSINALEKQKRIDDFNAPDSPYFAFLLSTRAGGVGINLATADTVIILDPDFNPHQDIQALSRAHRIGQKNKVLVFQLMTRDSAEEKIVQIGKKKMALDHVLIERMEEDDEAGVDLESILRYGAEALFNDDNPDDIVYDSASVDKLLDRSQMEDTKAADDQSAESQFSFARIWANDKSTLEERLGEDTESSTPNAGIWDKILQERERAYAEEAARKAETLGRGKRKRGNVDYGGKRDRGDAMELDEGATGVGLGEDHDSDVDFQDRPIVSESEEESEAEASDTLERKQPTVKARPFKRVKVPTGQAPLFNGDGASDYIPMGVLPPKHQCSACGELHEMGWCRLKIAGVEHCGLCGLAHVGYNQVCPHLNSEDAVTRMLQTLKHSPESRTMVEAATNYLRIIRGEMMKRNRLQEKTVADTSHNAAGHVQPPHLVATPGTNGSLPLHERAAAALLNARN